MDKHLKKENYDKDENIIEAIKSGDARRYNIALKHLIDSNTLKRSARKVIMEHGLDPDSEAGWILNDATFVFYESVVVKSFDLAKASISTFIIAVAKRMAYTYKRSQNRDVAKKIKLTEFDPINPLNDFSSHSIEKQLEQKEKKRAMKTAIKATGERCEKILSLYAQKYKGAEIASLTGLTPNKVKEALRTCKKRLHKYLIENDNIRILIRGK